MTHFDIVRNALALLCGMQGIATLVIDLNRTHATNPLWSGHARFHVVWQTSNAAMLAGLEIALLVIRGPYEIPRFYLAAILASVPMVGFLLALVARKLYRGTLSDPDGIPSAKIRFFGRQRKIDLNTAVVIAGLLWVVALIWYSLQVFALGENLRVARAARDGDVSHAAVEQVLCAKVGVHVD